MPRERPVAAAEATSSSTKQEQRATTAAAPNQHSTPRTRHKGRAKAKKMKTHKTRSPAKTRRHRSTVRPSSTVEQNSTDQQPMCPICHEPYSATTFPVVHGPCGHVACGYCSLKWQEKRSAKTCALCRTPILSITHCQMLEQLLKQQSSDGQPCTASSTADVLSSSTSSTVAADQDASMSSSSRAEIMRGLRTLSQGDLNALPADYRSHVVRLIASRAARKGDLPLLTKCVQHYKMRVSTNLLCDVASFWKVEPGPVLSLLQEQGGRLNGHCEERPLLCAVERDNTQMITALLEMKADPTKRTGPTGDTALHTAASHGQFAALRLLLDHGVPVNSLDGNGRTALVLAEKGLSLHQEACDSRQGQCERCDARVSIRNELKYRMSKIAPAAVATESAAASASHELDETDIQSDMSSSEWEDSFELSDAADDMFDEDSEEEDDGSCFEEDAEEEETETSPVL